jgi:hypothetical protein
MRVVRRALIVVGVVSAVGSVVAIAALAAIVKAVQDEPPTPSQINAIRRR